MVGESFYHAGPDEAEERITAGLCVPALPPKRSSEVHCAAQEQVTEDIKKSEGAMQKVKEEMAVLKQARVLWT